MSLGVLNGFEVLLAELWPLKQAFVFACTSDVLEWEGGGAGEGEGLHIEPCLLSMEGERVELSTSSVAVNLTYPCTLRHTMGKRKELVWHHQLPEASVLTTCNLSSTLPHQPAVTTF